MKTSIATLLLFAAAATPAAAINLRDGVRAEPLDNRSFEVIASTAGTAYQYWCGAATYARRVHDADWNDRIWIKRGRGPSETTGRKTAVQFSLDPVPGGEDRTFVLINRFKPGYSMTVTLADSYCLVRTVEP